VLPLEKDPQLVWLALLPHRHLGEEARISAWSLFLNQQEVLQLQELEEELHQQV
jgi:hypothetical protein